LASLTFAAAESFQVFDANFVGKSSDCNSGGSNDVVVKTYPLF
jgi:hypothetical protein